MPCSLCASIYTACLIHAPIVFHLTCSRPKYMVDPLRKSRKYICLNLMPLDLMRVCKVKTWQAHHVIIDAANCQLVQTPIGVRVWISKILSIPCMMFLDDQEVPLNKKFVLHMYMPLGGQWFECEIHLNSKKTTTENKHIASNCKVLQISMALTSGVCATYIPRNQNEKMWSPYPGCFLCCFSKFKMSKSSGKQNFW